VAGRPGRPDAEARARRAVAGLSDAPDCRTLATAAGDALEFFDVETGKSLGRYRLPLGDWKHSRYPFTDSIRFTPDGKKLISGHLDTTALVWAVPARPGK
jgi:hypothetical protein